MKKAYLLSFLLLFLVSKNFAQIIESQAWIESAFVKWIPDTTVDSYNVYITGNELTELKIDNYLIRNYGDYLRADIPGLSSGKYQIKIMKVKNDLEELAYTTDELTVINNDRSGYAFWNNRIPGAYKADGTLKDNAVVLYVTDNNKNSISLDVTGATSNPCVGLQTILDGFKKGKDNRPLAVRIIGQIKDLDYMLGGDLVIENANNSASFITVEGIGEDATMDGFGIRIKNASNVELRNLGFMNTDGDEGDNIGLQQNNDHVWVHNCDLFYGNAGSDADQIKGDGALDVKKSTYITLSYNHFWDCGKSNLLGLSEGTTEGLFISYHHNWYDHSDSRHPRVRYYSAHVYNNYYDGIAKYGVGSTLGSSVFVEANYFRNCQYPILTSMQGSDVWNESTQANDYKNYPTFSSEDGGSIKVFNNFMTGQKRFVAYGSPNFVNSTTDFDAFVVNTREEQVPATVKSVYGGNTYNNFDTDPSKFYSYIVDRPEDIPTIVSTYAGRIKGGDFKWTFNNAIDDFSSDVNTGLKTALINYKSSLVAVQGDSIQNNGGETGGETGGGTGGETGGTITESDWIQNFTISGKTSNFYSITGNLSSSYGSVVFNNLTLTQCLKMESSTVISFSTTQNGTIHLIFNSNYSGTVKIDEIVYTPTNGVLSVNLAAGNHTIQKASGSSYLFYMYFQTFTSLINSRQKTIYFDSQSGKLIINQVYETVTVIDAMGRKLKQFKNANPIDLSFLQSGKYFIQIENATKSQFIKVIKH